MKKSLHGLSLGNLYTCRVGPALPLLLVFSWVNGAVAQSSNPCNLQWGSLQTALSHSWGNVYVQVQSSTCSRYGGVCGWPKIALEHSFADNASLSVKLRGYDCENKVVESSFSTGGNKIEGNYLYKSSGNWHTFKQVEKVLRVEVWLDRDGDKYQILLDVERGINRVMRNGRPVAFLQGAEPPLSLPMIPQPAVVAAAPAKAGASDQHLHTAGWLSSSRPSAALRRKKNGTAAG